LKRLLASFLSLGLLAISCAFPIPTATPAPPEPPPNPTSSATIPDSPQAHKEDRSIFKNGLVESGQWALDGLDGASLYQIEFEIADDYFNITGSQEVRYTNNEEVALNEIHFRLFPNILGGGMRVSNLRVDGQLITPKYGLADSLMIAPLPNSLEPKQSVTLQMEFTVTIPQSPDQNYGVLAYYGDVLTLAHAYPMIAVYDDEGWNAENPAKSGDVVYADAAFYIVRVTAPKELMLVTSGIEVSRDEARQFQVVTVASGPARDFYLAGSPGYEVLSQTFGEVTIRSYAPAHLRDGAQMALDVAAHAVEIFSGHYAPYPYTELDIVATPTLALGVEYPGVIAITSRIYDVTGTYAGRPADVYLETTVVHEVGHQWFYNLIGNDQLDDPWLDEALAQFATLQYFADEYGPSGEAGFRSSLEGRWARVENANIPIGLPVAGYTGSEYGAIVYGRGPLFFVTLQEEMGLEPFETFILEYTHSLAWDIATPEILQTLAEKHCTCNLQSIFGEWVYP
jgi:hypothetical protein